MKKHSVPFMEHNKRDNAISPPVEEKTLQPPLELLQSTKGWRVVKSDKECVPYTYPEFLEYYRDDKIAYAKWKKALIHKDDQDIIYWVKLEIETMGAGTLSGWCLADRLRKQSKTIGDLLCFPDASDTAVVSLCQILGPDFNDTLARVLLDYLAGYYAAETLVYGKFGIMEVCDKLQMDYVLQNVVAPLTLQQWQKRARTH